jgi:micrococcal nuclease
MLVTAFLLCAAPVAVDGDTIRSCRAGSPNMRLAGVDAPEMPGHCHKPRVCEPGDGAASKAALQAFISSGRFRYRVIKQDRYGRDVVQAFVGKVNVSRWLIDHGYATFKAEWSGKYALR